MSVLNGTLFEHFKTLSRACEDAFNIVDERVNLLLTRLHLKLRWLFLFLLLLNGGLDLGVRFVGNSWAIASLTLTPIFFFFLLDRIQSNACLV